MRVLIGLGLALAFVGGPATAEKAAAPEDKIVCKRTNNTYTGSNLHRPKKTCMKASEWKLLEDEKDRTMRRVQDANGLNPNQPTALGGGPG